MLHLYGKEKKYKSRVKHKTLNPVWSKEIFTLGTFDSKDKLEITCWDRDRFSSDDFMGRCSVELSKVNKVGDHQLWLKLEQREKKNEQVSGSLCVKLEVRQKGLVPPTIGVELDTICMRDRIDIPEVIKDVLEHIRQKGLKEKGIFRVGGSTTDIKNIAVAVDAGAAINWEKEPNIHNATGFLKLFLRELPTPLLTYDLFRRVIIVGNEPDDSKVLQVKIKHILAILPESHFLLLHELIALAHKIVLEPSNAMDAHNIAIILAPNLLWEEGKKDSTDSILANSAAIEKFVKRLIESYKTYFPKRRVLITGMDGVSRLLSRSNSVVLPGEDGNTAVKSALGAEAYRLFVTFDADQNGSLDRDEFKIFYKEFLLSLGGKSPGKKKTEKAWKEVDNDGDGLISWNEFCSWWRSLCLD